MRDRKNVVIAALSAILIALGVAACGSSGDTPPPAAAQVSGQKLSEQIAAKANEAAAKEYASLLTGATAEVKNVEARDIRLMDPNRIGYVYHQSVDGKLLASYVIRGKMSSTGSQLTNTQNINLDQGNYNGGNTVTDSIGDDGTYGSEECGTTGVFFFLAANDGMVTICGGIITHSDVPLTMTSQPEIVVNGDAKVTTPIPAHGSTK